mmetsp:Transcript_1041/g.2301  ORF Transcript_1041/g.2301 Transcript_1041/m.2301 type:complete len:157 (+) Transcript_1041:247-717(+)
MESNQKRKRDAVDSCGNMSEQPKASKTAEPKLCKTGCGFFEDDVGTKKGGGGDESGKVEAKAAESPRKSLNESAEVVAEPSISEAIKAEPLLATNATVDADPPTPTKKKKKTKKKGYKSMMAGMLAGTSASRDVEKEKEKLKEVIGGGHFQKIDKI